VYKLGALQNADGSWQPKVKLSEQVVKTSIPGILQVQRFEAAGVLPGAPSEFIGDLIYDELLGSDPQHTIVDPKDPTRRKRLQPDAVARDVLIPVMKDGQRLAEAESLQTIRERVQHDLSRLNAGSKRFLNPHEYPVGLDSRLQTQRDRMIREAREGK
jgi:nicotinate phosphoribosyltransferase